MSRAREIAEQMRIAYQDDPLMSCGQATEKAIQQFAREMAGQIRKPFKKGYIGGQSMTAMTVWDERKKLANEMAVLIEREAGIGGGDER